MDDDAYLRDLHARYGGGTDHVHDARRRLEARDSLAPPWQKKKALPPRQRLQLPIPHEIKVLCTAKIHNLPTRSNLLESRSLSFPSLAPRNPRTLNLETYLLV